MNQPLLPGRRSWLALATLGLALPARFIAPGQVRQLHRVLKKADRSGHITGGRLYFFAQTAKAHTGPPDVSDDAPGVPLPHQSTALFQIQKNPGQRPG